MHTEKQICKNKMFISRSFLLQHHLIYHLNINEYHFQQNQSLLDINTLPLVQQVMFQGNDEDLNMLVVNHEYHELLP
jgi:hypothetical protein